MSISRPSPGYVVRHTAPRSTPLPLFCSPGPRVSGMQKHPMHAHGVFSEAITWPYRPERARGA